MTELRGNFGSVVEIRASISATGPRGPKGDAFTFEDFTPEQLEALRGPRGAPAEVNGKSGESILLRMGDIQIVDNATGDLYGIGVENGEIHFYAVGKGGDAYEKIKLATKKDLESAEGSGGGAAPEEPLPDVAGDAEVDEMLDEIFGTGEEENPDVATDAEVDEMLDEIFDTSATEPTEKVAE